MILSPHPRPAARGGRCLAAAAMVAAAVGLSLLAPRPAPLAAQDKPRPDPLLRRDADVKPEAAPRPAGAAGARADAVIALKHTGAVEVAAALRKLLASSAPLDLAADDTANALVVRGAARDVARIKDLVAQLDVPGAADKAGAARGAGAELRVFQLKHLAADDAAKLVADVLKVTAPTSPRVTEVRVTSTGRSSVLVYGPAPDLDLVEAVLARFDVPSREDGRKGADRKPAPASDRGADRKPAPPRDQVDARLEQLHFERRLLELDLREAELVAQEARGAFQRAEALGKAAGGAITEAELEARRFAFEKSKIAVERAKLRLDAAARGIQAAGREKPAGPGEDRKP
jgi:hypothetical protein